MELEKRVHRAQLDREEADRLIREYQNFILACARNVRGQFISEMDDELSIALMAFDEAIRKYDSGKGPFLPFAELVIRNRMTDYLRTLYRDTKVLPFSTLEKTDEQGNTVAFDVPSQVDVLSDVKLEIEALSEELNKYGISFRDLVKVSPKSKKTKQLCKDIVLFLLSNSNLVENIRQMGLLPIQRIVEKIGVNRKVVERHRKYIIAVIIILSGDYDVISSYFEEIVKGVKQ